MTRKKTTRNGTAFALLPLLIVVLLVVAGMMVDYGSFQAERSSMQNAADAAALAAVMRIGNINSGSARDEAFLYASEFANHNQRFQGDVLTPSNLQFGKWNSSNESFSTGAQIDADAIKVTVVRGSANSNYLTTPFFSFFGVTDVTAAVSAVARLSGSSSAKAVPIALRTTGFGDVLPDLSDANNSLDGPSEPDLNRFEVDDDVIVMMFGHEDVAHLVLDLGADGPGASTSEVRDILANRQLPVSVQVGDECSILYQGGSPDELAEELLERFDLPSNHADRTIIMPVIEELGNTRNSAGYLVGDVRVGDFVPVYLDRVEVREIKNPNKPSKRIDVNVVIGVVTTKRVNTDWGGASPSGVGNATLRIVELVN